MLFAIFTTISHYVLFLISYLSNKVPFPKPLSLSEEKKYINKYKNEGDKSAQKILIEHNMRLVAYIAKKYSSPIHDDDDLISIGSIGLIKAIETFDHSKKIALASYASRCIENEILMVIRTLKKIKDDISLEGSNSEVDTRGRPIKLIETLKNEDEDVDEKVDRSILLQKLYKSVVNELNEREQQVIILRYGLDGAKDCTQHEVAKRMNISRSYVSRIEKKAIKKMHDKLTENDNNKIY